MKILDYIKNDSILIIPNNIKNKLLYEISSMDVFFNIKFMSLDEFKKEYYFNYSSEALLFIMDNYKLEIDISKTILELIYYIDINKEYKEDKLCFLKEIKNSLISNDLLIFNPMFKNFISSKDVFIYGYSKVDAFLKNMLDEVNAIEIDTPLYENANTVRVLNTLEDEVEYVFNEISILINNGIDLNKIKLVNVSNEYLYTIRRFSKMFSIPISIKDSIYSNKIIKVFLSKLKESTFFDDSLSYVKENFDMTNEKNNSIYKILFDISNTYNEIGYSFDNIYKLVVRDIKNTSISSKKLSKELEITNLEDNIFDSDYYVFLLGFNQKEIPVFYKDEEFLSDDIKATNGLLIELTADKNILSKNSVIESIKRINNLIITAKQKTISGEVLISNLASELRYDIKYVSQNYMLSFSDLNSKIRLSKYLDDFIKYGTRGEYIDLLYSNYDIDYLSYNNKFTGIDNLNLLEKFKPQLVLSYTSIDNYYHCAFKYYLSDVLKLDKYEETFSTVIGNLFHYILSICFNETFDFEKEYQKYIDNLNLTEKEMFFINKLKNELILVIEEVKRLHKETGLTKLLMEHKITLDKSTIIPVIFKGFVDKIMYKESNNTLVSIIDYKTGKADINLYNVIYGLSMQLPIYLYLVKKSNLFKNVRFTGFYLQKILNTEVSYTPNKSYLEQKKSNLKLDGYSNSDESVLEVFIPDYEDSSFVKSMKMTSKGFSHYSKVLSDEQINNLIDVIDNNINKARDLILKGDFNINPKQIGIEKIGCNFCKFKDICYRRPDDFVRLKENDSLKFLGGE